MKYLIIIVLSLSFALPVSASVFNGVVNTDTIVSTGIDGVLMEAPTANPNPSAGPFTSTQTVTLSAHGATSFHYFLNTTDFSSELTCSTGATANPITIESSALLRAIACYGSTAGPMASFSYEFSAPPATVPASSSGGGGGGGGGGYTPPTTPPTTAQADFDNSGTVDILDFNILITNWGTTSGATKATGDTDNNGTVDILDFNLLIINWQS